MLLLLSAAARLKRSSLCFHPPSSIARPSTSSMFPMIDAGQRGLDDVDVAFAQGDEREDQLGRVPERAADQAPEARAYVAGELLGAAPHEAGQRDDGKARREEDQRRRAAAQPEPNADRDKQEHRPQEFRGHCAGAMIAGPPLAAPKGSGPVVPEVQLRFVRKVLVANRGEIAVRVIRAARESGLQSVAVFADCDRGARHMRMADEAWPLGGNAPGESYFRIDKIVDAARASGADAVHPGYGFLAENPEFADACESAGLTFIGPSATAIRRMGSKTAAREVAVACGVPVVPGTAAPIPAGAPEADVLREAERIGYPLMLKAVAGGGGKGMRVVARPEDLHGALRAARSEAQTAFGNGAVFVERRLGRPRHIEIQLLGDRHGTVVPFVERECSVQRRHQKVLEESPSPSVDATLRAAMAEAARKVAASVGYTNAGTIEFLLDEDGRFYFLEMNTRLQVEHPITEAVTGVDLVRWQFRLADGERLTLTTGETLSPRGHAIEGAHLRRGSGHRVHAVAGRILHLRPPSGPGVRDDGGYERAG